MRYKLRMSSHGGILGGGHLPWALSLVLVLGEESDGELAGLNASRVWRWRFEDRCLVVGSSVTLVLHWHVRVSHPGTTVESESCLSL